MRPVIVLTIAALLGSCTPELPVLEQIRLLGELRVVTKNTPTTYYYGANERHGIEYELATRFADHLGVRLALQTTDRIAEIVPDVVDRKVHIAAAGLTAVRDLPGVEFGPDYQQVVGRLVYRMGEPPPRSLADIGDGTVAVQAGSVHIDTLERAAGTLPDLGWTELPSASAEPLLKRVADGTADYAIVNSNEYELLRHYYPRVLVGFDLDSAAGLAWAVPADARHLREAVAGFFASIEATGELDRILDRYYVSPRDLDFVGSRAFVWHLNERLPALRDAFEAAERETGIDWKWLAAIGYQESHWDPAAVSPTGVEGVMMLTETTARMVGVEDRADAEESIRGGARYLARVLDKFPERIPEPDRMLMALAAYNVGFGHVEDARIITEHEAADKDRWEDVRQHLPLLADEAWYPFLKRGYAHGTVPVQYVDNVRQYHWLLDRLTGTELFTEIEANADPEPELVPDAI